MLAACALTASPLAATAFKLADQPYIPSEPSTVTVTLPVGLKTALGNITHNEAMFGVPSYGDEVTGVVMYVNDSSSAPGCLPFILNAPGSAQVIALIDRGGCHFAQKVYNAQMAGASAVLIADTQPLCTVTQGACNVTACDQYCPLNGIIPDAYNPTDCECILPYMADDPKYLVSIPSVIIELGAATALKQCLAGGSFCTNSQDPKSPFPVTVKMQWSIPSPDNRVEWALWSMPLDPEAETLRQALFPVIVALGASAQFEARYFVYDGYVWGCNAPGLPCGTQCTNNGLYCSPDPDQNLDRGPQGADVVAEDLRQICIFKAANATTATDHASKYFLYTKLFSEKCVGVDFTGTCSSLQQEAAGINPDTTANCVVDSGDVQPNGGENSLLKNEVSLRENLLIVNLPTIMVNQQIQRGTLTPLSVLATVCAGFLSTPPAVCQCKVVDADWLDYCAEKGYDNVPAEHGGPVKPSSGTSKGVVAAIVILVLVVIGLVIGGVIAYRRTHRNMVTMLEDYRRMDNTLDESEKASLNQL